jgi:hypothetical protein
MAGYSTSTLLRFDETVELVRKLGSSVVGPKTAVPRVAWVTMASDRSKNDCKMDGRSSKAHSIVVAWQ